ncbi:site-specific integrase [Nocardia cyriacigeorgica]|uniref:Putative phage integrase n=1 Tax=Nocardia cyriacigeorgica (strain GUH-2) TaxID=1127134 RepID=H6R9X5_NOCCG|nr:tyrosine-type recombinase/integrase [Nocardia cyriacigeorgica]BDT84595.1 putative phage integrase [Nocardia cyriacigeorgica]CCF61183.1 putative phage integrase [Nocardia cyriacigeorgica GUH-2]
MPRQRLAPGEWGKITTAAAGPGKFTATTYVRDADGKRRQVERSGRSEEDARRNLLRELKDRTAPTAAATVNDKTTLAELFTTWLATKKKTKQQTRDLYAQVWKVHGEQQIGALRIRELPTSRAERHIEQVAAKAPAQARNLRVILLGMFALACRYDVLPVNPIREVTRAASERTPARALTPDEFARVRAAVRAYATRREGVGGPVPGRLLPAFVDVMASTGARPNEVLALRWSDVDLLADPPTATITGTLVDHGRVKGKALHRQDIRKGGAPAHTVVLPRLAVEALTGLVGESGINGPVFASRGGGWVSLANLRRSLRAALADQDGLGWVTPYSFRRTVASVIRDELGPAGAQQQLSHAKLSTTEQHYLQRQTHGPDVRATLDRYAAGM